jgi:hypothetical protein
VWSHQPAFLILGGLSNEELSAYRAVALCGILVACGVKTTSERAANNEAQLSRPTALSLLRSSNVKSLGWGPETCRVRLRLNATVHQNTSPQELEGIMAELARGRNFYQSLVDTGMLKDEVYKTGESGFGAGSFTYHNYYYSTVPQPDISFVNDDVDPSAVFVLDNLSIDGVTGISQNGPSAEIVATVSYPLTPVANTLTKLRSKYNDQWGFTDCYAVMQQISHSEEQHFRAKKFDDGWRIQ